LRLAGLIRRGRSVLGAALAGNVAERIQTVGVFTPTRPRTGMPSMPLPPLLRELKTNSS
jgi:hypothetical protein